MALCTCFAHSLIRYVTFGPTKLPIRQ